MKALQLIRKALRAQRNALAPEIQQAHAEAVLAHLSQQPCFQKAQHMGVYLPNDGELDPRPCIREAWKRGIRCYLPRLSGTVLSFFRYAPDTPLIPNQWGILEPQSTEEIPAKGMDLVLVPLVGFNDQGDRLGRGKGYYDKTFAGYTNLVGVAHACQKNTDFRRQPWDVPCKAIVTEAGWQAIMPPSKP